MVILPKIRDFCAQIEEERVGVVIINLIYLLGNQ